jgi:hypothetical protein
MKNWKLWAVIAVVMVTGWAVLTVWAGGPPSYSGTTWSDVDESYPQDEEDAQYGAAAIRQIRRIAKNMFAVEHNADGTHGTNSIVASYLASNAVTTAKIADGAVTISKLSPGIFNTTNYLHAASGYETLPSGLIMQWTVGDYTAASESASIDVNFPKAFPGACLFVQVGTQIEDATIYGDHWYQLVSFNASKAVVLKQVASGSASTPVRPLIFAIGY